MKRTLQIALLSAMVLLAASAAKAADAKKDQPQPKLKKRAIQLQPGQIRFFPGGAINTSAGLLRNPKVQEELKLTDEQKNKIKEAHAKLNAERRELFAAAQGLQGQERNKKFREASQKLQKKTAEVNKTIKDSLTKEQSERLDQISLQRMGLRALSNKEIAAKLKITDEQKQKIVDVQAESQQKLIQLRQDVRNGNVERAKYRGKIQEINKETEKNTLEVLTKEQQAEFDKLKGEKFDFPQRQFRAIQIQPGQLKQIQGQPIKIRIQIQGGGKIKILPIKKQPKPEKVS